MPAEGKRIKICFLSILAYPLFNRNVKATFGGAEVDLYNLAVKLSESGKYDVAFVVGDYGQEKEEVYNNIRVKKVNHFNLGISKFPHKLLKRIALCRILISQDADIYMTEACSEILGWVALVSGKIRGRKIIFRLAHDLDTNLQYWRDRSLSQYLFYSYGIRNADVIISQTETQKRLLQENMNLVSMVVKNGFFLDRNVSLEGKKHILWVARSQEWKRPWLFIELARNLPQEKFVIIMPENNDIQAYIRESAHKLGNVTFIDYVPFFDIQEYYDRAKLFVNTSEYEGFPNSFIQACMAKTPILSFKVNPDNFINRYGLGLCCEDSMDRAVGFVKEMDEKSLGVCGENAFSYVRQNHDIDEIAVFYEKIIGNLVCV